MGRPVPPRRLADRIGHPVEHERQRGHRRAGQRAADRHARRQVAGPPERPRQRRRVVERHLPDRDARRRRPRDRRAAAAGAPPSPRCAARQGRSVARHHQDRPDAPAGRDPGQPRPGSVGLCRAGRVRHRAGRGRAAAAPPARAGRDGGRHRAQHDGRLRRGDRRRTRDADRLPFVTAPNKFEALATPRYDGRGVGRAQRAGGQPDQDRQRFPPAWFAARARGSANSACPRTSRAARSCRARSTRRRPRR